MAFQFSREEVQILQEKFDKANSSLDDDVLFADVYAYIADRLITEDPLTGATPADDPEVKKVAFWFAGASQINRGEGIFSRLIREFSFRQGELRYGPEAFGKGENERNTLMQLASDTVALNAIQGILNEDGVLPTLEEIAEQDATGVGQVLFNADPNDPAAPEQNSAWSGTIFFALMGGDETWRLLDETTSAANFDTLADLRDLVFAYDSFVYAADQVEPVDAFINEVADISLLIETFLFDPFSPSLNFEEVLTSATEDTYAADAIAFIRGHDRYELVDQLGELLLNETDRSIPTYEANFAERARALFTAPTINLDLSLELIDSMTASQLAAEALSSSARGQRFRYAILNNTPFIVQAKR